MKFVYQGRVLNDESATLQSLNITDGCLVQVHVGRPHETPQQRARAKTKQQQIAVIAVIVGIAWVFFFLTSDVQGLLLLFICYVYLVCLLTYYPWLV